MAQDSLSRAQRHIVEGRADLAVNDLREYARRNSRDFGGWKLLGFALHEEQLETEAAQAFGQATSLDDADPQAAMAHAHSSYLAGLPSVALFRRLVELVPGNLPAIRGLACALAAEGEPAAAEALLVDAVRSNPAWLEGHKYLASMRFTAGDAANFAASYADACHVEPRNLALRLAWFRAMAQARQWEHARAILENACTEFGELPELVVGRIFVASESGQAAEAAALFARTQSIRDPVRDMALVRHSLRLGDLATAEAVAARNVDTAGAAVFWPYLGLARRLRGDARAHWLDGSPPYVETVDLRLDAAALSRLADLLRGLHRARSPFVEQSVRGGTQTDQNLLLRHEPELQDLKARIRTAVRAYVERLPAPIPGHPLLGTPRDEVLDGRVYFSGSWSVRLAGQGHNVSHTHPLGWISSALYISVPQGDELGARPAGWLQFGTPPAELGLQAQPTLQVEPVAGRLVLFPSRLWHSTVPYAHGERLAVSFDVRTPRAQRRLDAEHRSSQAS